MNPQKAAQKALEEEIVKAGLDKAEQGLLIGYAVALTGLAMNLMTEDAENGIDKHRALRAMISACKICLHGLELQRMDFAGGEDLADD